MMHCHEFQLTNRRHVTVTFTAMPLHMRISISEAMNTGVYI